MCTKPEGINGMLLNEKGDKFNHGHEYELKCAEGYNLKTKSTNFHWICENGKWKISSECVGEPSNILKN